ncbi:MAG: sulfotransferase domain-containing protein [Bacteroidetes bacterium]|nr:sulfotransferase domain-containing protein [Bacteroidota bacterium]
MTKYLLERIPTQDTKKKVNLFIIGEQKCGTTSLFNLLIQNKSVLAYKNKECHYFNTCKIDQDINYQQYHHNFRHPVYKRYHHILDASPDYLSDSSAFEKIFSYNPNAKIITILRNPVQRFISAYNFYFSNIIQNIESVYEQYFQYTEKGKAEYAFLKQNRYLSIEDFFQKEVNGFSPIGALKRGLYSQYLHPWEKVFDKKNRLLLIFERLTNPESMESEINQLENFVHLSLKKTLPFKNTSFKKNKTPAKVIQLLEEYYFDEMKICQSLYGYDFTVSHLH